jgi:hypothetical protein
LPDFFNNQAKKMDMKLFTAVIIFPCIVTACIYLQGYVRTQDKEKIITEIMNYPMPDIITRCQKDFDYTDEDMVILERELKRYLTLCALKEDADSSINMYSEDVDNLWHSFILFTTEYADFCDTYAGHFMHHVPETDFTPKPRDEFRRDFCAFAERYEAVFNEEPHAIWFLNMCEE